MHPIRRIFLSALLGILAGLLAMHQRTGGVLPTPSQAEAQPLALYRTFLPIVLQAGTPFPPLHQTSYYMKTVDINHSWSLGCALGLADEATPGVQNTIIVLAYGTPRNLGGGVYGTSLFGFGPVSTSQISAAVQMMAVGYWYCADQDRQSVLNIAIGTNNYGSAVTYEHGQAWAGMVNDTQQWVVNNGYAGQVLVTGASDMELGWNTPSTTRAWVNGYDSVNLWRLYNFGDAAGCPPYGDCGTGAYPEWTVEDVWYISWGASPSWPLPLIYTTSGSLAEQWYRMSLYGYTQHGQRMDIAGVVTQWQACQQRGGCSGTNNTPEQGYMQLYNKLNADWRTAQSINWSLDFKWWGE